MFVKLTTVSAAGVMVDRLINLDYVDVIQSVRDRPERSEVFIHGQEHGGIEVAHSLAAIQRVLGVSAGGPGVVGVLP